MIHRNVSIFVRILLLIPGMALLGACSFTGPVPQPSAPEPVCITSGWPHQGSDLAPDPAVSFGALDNGLRYVIMPNAEPRDRVGLYLNIQAGSLAEKEDQRGYAHFLEHMLFNGTTHYPPGTLVEYFQSIGMGFGSDTNAHTAYNETVYRLLLPDGTEKHLRDGLLVMADYARGALLLPDEVQRERGIILAEKRTRDSARYRLYKKKTRFTYSGTRLPQRFPIGVEETISAASSEGLRSYYDSWYRPENMIVLVVGDVDPSLAEQIITEQFTPLASAGGSPGCYDLGMVEESGTRFLHVYEPETGYTEITLGTNWNTSPGKDTAASEREELLQYFVALLFQNRLKQLIGEKGSPLTKAYSYSGDYLERFGYAMLVATVEGERWNDGLDLLSVTLRQGEEQGFSEQELARVKKEFLAELEKDMQTASSRDSRKLAGDIIRSLNSNNVFMSPQQEYDLYAPMAHSLTLEEVNSRLRGIWTGGNRQVIVAGTAQHPSGDSLEKNIQQVYERSLASELPRWKAKDVAHFPYLSRPTITPKVTATQQFDSIGLDRVSFANQTVVQVKATDFKPNEVQVQVHFGQGKLEEPVPGMAMLAQALVNESGTGRLKKDELEEALSGTNVRVGFSIGPESFFLRGKGLSSELEILFQVVQARLEDPAFREDAFRLSRERFAQMYEQMTASVEGTMEVRGERFLAGDSPRYGLPPKKNFMDITLDQVRNWLAPAFAGAPLEISVVGDVDPAVVAELGGRYFGTGTRTRLQGELPATPVFPSGESLKLAVPTQVDKAMVVVAWPTDDFWDISRTRRLNILAAVLSDRLRLEIREKLGAAYSPQVYNHSSKTDKGFGLLRAMLTVDPAMAVELAGKVREVAASLTGGKISDEELKRSLEPSLTSIKDMKETNRYWMDSVITLSSRHPEQLEWPLSIQEDFAAITPVDIRELAERYLAPERSAEVILLPEPH